MPEPQLQQHPLRERLYDELHARPFTRLGAPARITHMAILCTPKQTREQFQCLCKLLGQLGHPAPKEDKPCLQFELDGLRIRREKHREFTTFTFFDLAPQVDNFATTGLNRLPPGWVGQLPGELIAAFHLALETELELDSLAEKFFDEHRLIGGSVQHGAASMWSSFRLHNDGFGRFVISNHSLNPSQLGRMVQRLIEVETYRLMALMALPEAQKLSPDLVEIEQQLARITRQLAESQVENEQSLLVGLTDMAADVEDYRTRTSYRFHASRAYQALVNKRLEELQEDDPPGHLTMAEFISRRLSPAVRTCNSVSEQLNDLAQRMDHIADIMRTRVELSIQSQNQQLLTSMDQRSKIQLMMQHTVEGLSVAAISYYLVGLVKYLLEALYASGLAFDKSLATGISVPVVVITVWLVTRSIHKRFHKLAHPEEHEHTHTE